MKRDRLRAPRPSPTLLSTMKDDPKKHLVDRRFLSSQAHEIAYVRRKLAKENPGRSPAEIARAVDAARAHIAPSESRQLVMAICRLMLNPR